MSAPDRRIVRTKRLLRGALFDLIAAKGYENLTINEIADHADVGRATFYIHYKDKDDLLQQALADEFSAFAEFMQAHTPEVEYRLRRVLEYIEENAAHFKVLLVGIGKPNVYLFTRNFMMVRILARLKERAPTQTAVPLELIALHVAGSILNLILWWLENDRPCTVAELETLCQQLIGEGVWKVAGVEPSERRFL